MEREGAGGQVTLAQVDQRSAEGLASESQVGQALTLDE